MGATQISSIRRVASTRLPTQWGVFTALGFERDLTNGTRRVETALAIVLGDLDAADPPLLRIHAQCLTGELFRSLRCDCADQLDIAMREIAREGRGLVIYEHQEGRGIGLMAKLKAYALQDVGLDTVDANRALGFDPDCRDFGLPAAILHMLGIHRVRLLSNNPDKLRALSDSGIEVVERVPCEAAPNPHSFGYLRTKKDRLGHTLTFGQTATSAAPLAAPEFASIEAALRELQAGRIVVVIDDEDRENEGDLTMAAEMITPDAINFMAAHARGLICLAMTGERLDELELPQMVPESTALGGTAFTVSIDVEGHGVTTGISAHDRAQTIRAAIDPRSEARDFARPGHVFPLRARAGGVLERRGQTEAAVDLARLAGLYPAGVICEIFNDDGTMARVPDLVRFCQKHQLLMITVADLVRYRLESDEDGPLAAIDGSTRMARNELVSRRDLRSIQEPAQIYIE
jgi:3,4-dihydroxy-2-butanone 4-phosphate synthase/GTP cyclohydrolase II